MRWHTPLLFPFSVLFDIVTGIRNRLYDNNAKPVAQFDVPVIGVGNLSVGGTGKTPMIEYLIRLLCGEFAVATLSRGYGRRTKGFRLAGDTDNAATMGDEPFQFYCKFADKAVVAVGEDRALAIPNILHERPDTGVILLDDAFQHRRVRPSFQVLLTDYHNLFTHDYLLPAGRLREARRGAARADVIVVTKCPAKISANDMLDIEGGIRKYSRSPVFFSKIAYGSIRSATSSSPYRPGKVVLVSGIANPAPLEHYIRLHHDVVHHFAFADHHHYSASDLTKIRERAASEGAAVVTTEKDLVKIDPGIFRESSVPLYFLPIEIEFLKNGKEFDEMVLNAVRSHVR